MFHVVFQANDALLNFPRFYIDKNLFLKVLGELLRLFRLNFQVLINPIEQILRSLDLHVLQRHRRVVASLPQLPNNLENVNILFIRLIFLEQSLE